MASQGRQRTNQYEARIEIHRLTIAWHHLCPQRVRRSAAVELLVAVNGRPLPEDSAARAATLADTDGDPVTLTLRRHDGSTQDEVVVRSPDYKREAFAGSGLDVSRRRLLSFLLDLLSRLVGLVAALALFLRRPCDPVAMLFCVSILLNASPVATKATMRPGLGGFLVVALAQFSLVLTGLLFPHGRMSTPWHGLALVVALATLYKDVSTGVDLWLPVPITSPVLYGMNFASLFTLLAAVVAHYRLAPEGVERQQFKPVAFAYTATTVTLLVLFCITRGPLDTIGAFQSVWSAVLSAVIMKPLHDRLLKWTNRSIRAGLVDLKEDLPPLIGDLRETEPTAAVVDAVLHAVEKGMHARHSAVADLAMRLQRLEPANACADASGAPWPRPAAG